jgi:hypothetical protein
MMARPIGKTSLITVGSAIAVAIVVSIPTNVVNVREDNSVVGWPTTDFYIMKPLSTSQPNRYPMGYAYQFLNPNGYKIGDVAGYIQTVTGTTTFSQDETGDV